MIRRISWAIAASGAALLLAGCNVIPQGRSATAQASNNASQGQPRANPQPMPAPRPAPVAAPAPVITRPPVFATNGELTQGGWLRGSAPVGTRALLFNGEQVTLADDGNFIIAFDRDAPLQQQLSARLANGQTINLPLTLTARAWDIEHVAVGRRPGSAPSAEYERRRAPEIAMINAARSVRSASQGWKQQFIWPVRGRISGYFGNQRVYRGEPGSYHSGMDIATGESGTPYVAPADGVVVLAAESPFTLEGYLLMIDHGMGLNSAFLHSSRLAVKTGDVVRQGQYIGNIGSTGRSTGPHLHWGMKWGSSRIDPILFTGPMNGVAAAQASGQPAAQ